MAVSCLLCFVIIVYGAGDGDLGVNCNSIDANTDTCSLVFKGRSAAFSVMTWCALVLSLECLHPRTSVFRFPTQDLWANQFYFGRFLVELFLFSQLFISLSSTPKYFYINLLLGNGVLQLVVLYCFY